MLNSSTVAQVKDYVGSHHPNTSDSERRSVFMSREHIFIAKSPKQTRKKNQKPTIKNKRSEMHINWAYEGFQGHLAMTRIIIIQKSTFYYLFACYL